MEQAQPNVGGAKKTAVITAYFLIYVVWGSTYYVIGATLEALPPFLLGAFRFTAAGLILLIRCVLRGEPVFNKNLIRKSMISGLVLLFADMAVVMLAQRYLSSSLVAIIASSTAIWIMIFDVPMWRRNFRSPSVITGLFLGFSGVAALYLEQLQPGHRQSEYGILILLLGCISWALGTLYAKYRSSGAEAVNAFGGSAWQMLSAAGMFWLFALLGGEASHTDLSLIPPHAWYSLAYLVVCGSIGAYSAYVWLLKVRPATEVGTHAYVNPLVAVFIGVVIGKETVTPLQLAGLCIILLSVMLVSRKKDPHS